MVDAETLVENDELVQDKILSYSAVMVGKDTGPMHWAAMLGVPTVTLYFHGSEGTWFPYGSDERAEHVPLHPACSKPRCLASCREVGKCGGKIEFGTVSSVWRALRDNFKPTEHPFRSNKPNNGGTTMLTS